MISGLSSQPDICCRFAPLIVGEPQPAVLYYRLMRLRDKVAVVTGGSSGIGLATARLFQDEGAKVAVLDTQAAPQDLRRIDCDVSGEDEVERAFDSIAGDIGPPDVLVNCAGVAARQTV